MGEAANILRAGEVAAAGEGRRQHGQRQEQHGGSLQWHCDCTGAGQG